MGLLTVRMIISSLLGWVSVGAAIAAFIPLIITNAVQRRNGTSPWFLGVWLVADAINVAGLIILGAQPTQIVLAVWYCLADGSMALELYFFGHSDWGAPDPKRCRNLIKRFKRLGVPWWFKVTTHFAKYTAWDDIILTTVCVFLCTTAWGGIMLTGIWKEPETFKVEIPTEWETPSFALGMAGSLIFSFARIAEFVSGESTSKRNEEPSHEIDDPLFWLLILENIFNLASIFALSSDLDYIKVESPWIIGSGMSIIFDCILLWRVTVWRSKYYNDDNPEWVKVKPHREAAKREIEAEARELAVKELVQMYDGIIKDAKDSPKLMKEVLENQTALKPIHTHKHKLAYKERQRTAAVKHYNDYLRADKHEEPNFEQMPIDIAPDYTFSAPKYSGAGPRRGRSRRVDHEVPGDPEKQQDPDEPQDSDSTGYHTRAPTRHLTNPNTQYYYNASRPGDSHDSGESSTGRPWAHGHDV
ncbi:hypothetical protein JCM3770_001896 [Rhodotorula araucariae]